MALNTRFLDEFDVKYLTGSDNDTCAYDTLWPWCGRTLPRSGVNYHVTLQHNVPCIIIKTKLTLSVALSYLTFRFCIIINYHHTTISISCADIHSQWWSSFHQKNTDNIFFRAKVASGKRTESSWIIMLNSFSMLFYCKCQLQQEYLHCVRESKTGCQTTMVTCRFFSNAGAVSARVVASVGKLLINWTLDRACISIRIRMIQPKSRQAITSAHP